MSPAPPGFNYADFFGIKTVDAAAIFAALYLILLGYYLLQAKRHPTYVLITLSVFCAIRTSAFAIRTALAASDTAGQNLGLYIAEQVLFSVGFVGLLYSSYTLVLDRELLLNSGERQRTLSKIMQERRYMRIVMMAGVACGIVGINDTSSGTTPGDISTGNALLKAGAAIFFALTVIQGIFTVIYTKHEILAARNDDSNSEKQKPLGATHGGYILCAISVLLLIREAFAVATVGNIAKSGNEHLWYPLVAVPEILAVILYAAPGLVPPRSDLNQGQSQA
ncbi:hypothetical protein BDN72DRAFT_841538 [Pluteus cervinus]|uniref:Uncharacterized protein n=1 Tax=Pluteus cervinus TaxID=181527 RepID=A0ACD3ASR2_9AGAR|nr:hypothetical protein BDN72DRAFT_841538 [Pluteus cervinus]